MANLIKALAADGDFSICLLDGSALYKEVMAVHNQTPIVNAALAELLMATALMRVAEKDEATRISVSLSGDAAINKMVSYAAQDGLKGFCDMRTKGQANAAQYDSLFGTNGKLAIVKEYANGMRSTGQAALIGDNMATNFTDYYMHSEQQLTFFAIERATANSKTHYVAAMLTLLPSAKPASVNAVYDKLSAFTEIADQLAQGTDLADILSGLMAELPYKTILCDNVHYQCNCSRQKMTSALISLGVAQLRELRNEDGGAEMNCHFCNKKYNFNEQDLDMLIEEISK